MADIVLAEHRGQAWLVSGDRYIDDLLANKLPSDISIEIVSCGSHADVIALLPPDDGTRPCWAIHPGIVKRLQRMQGEHMLSFSQWSALLDDNANAVIRAAAERAASNLTAPIILISYMSAEAPVPARALNDLRKSLIEAALAEHGVALTRVEHVRRDPVASSAHDDRFDIVIE